MTKKIASEIDVVERVRTGRLRAVDYLRVSSEEQAKGYGMDYTGKATKEFIKRKKWDHVDTFKDKGVEGSLSWRDRDDLPRLMKLARQSPRPFDVVVVAETRAIGRKDRVFYEWVWMLKDLGIFVAIVDKDIDNTTEQGEADMRREANYAFEEWLRIRARTQGGRQEGAEQKAKSGGCVGGKPPYGWCIKNKGVRKKSRYVLDVKSEYAVLCRARDLVVESKGDFSAAARQLNSEGLLTRSGVPWTQRNLHRRLMSDAVLKGRIVFRKTDQRHGSTGRDTKVGSDGKPLFGRSVVIELPRAFTRDEVQQLKDAVEVSCRKPAAKSGEAHLYPLSGRITSYCDDDRHYVGTGRSGRDRRYGCTASWTHYAGEETCDCKRIDADLVEAAAWSMVIHLLKDPEELRERAQQWAGAADHAGADHEARIADLGRQILRQDRAIAAVAAAAALEAAEDGGSEFPEDAVKKATETLRIDRRELVAQRALAAAWHGEAQSAATRARDVEQLAMTARSRLAKDVSLSDKVWIFSLLRVQLKITEPVEALPYGKGCPVARWFRDRGRVVPRLTDQTWALVEPLFRTRSELIPARFLLESFLIKACTGLKFSELPAAQGGHAAAVYARWRHWQESGRWGEAMALLGEEPGDAPSGGVPLPKMLLTMEIIPGQAVPLSSPWRGACNLKST
ncbi:recombinase family protein [Streptomyces sp. NPDC058293]|uniref:recombinase family protein n=1 Tax=Streptomyces sp. NPDC058293 TaxID=3346429 RepID=UPI0036EFDE9E